MSVPPLPFHDRRDAGYRLGTLLSSYKDSRPVVLALPRGGVPVAFEVARALGAPLDLALVRKMGAPGHPELGIGSVVDGRNPHVVLNEDVVQQVGADEAYIAREKEKQLREIERRRATYQARTTAISVQGRTVIVVDDGIATGGTIRAVLKALGQSGANKVIVAVPVAPRDTVDLLQDEADAVVCLAWPEPFLAVGAHYEDFAQTQDSEVVELLKSANSGHLN